MYGLLWKRPAASSSSSPSPKSYLDFASRRLMNGEWMSIRSSIDRHQSMNSSTFCSPCFYIHRRTRFPSFAIWSIIFRLVCENQMLFLKKSQCPYTCAITSF